MDRRHALYLLASSIPLAGCTSPGTDARTGTASDEPTSPTPTPDGTPDHSDGVFVVLQNQADQQVTAAVTISTDSAVAFEDEATVDSGEIRHLYPDIAEVGAYRLTVAVDEQRETEFPFDVAEFDFRSGSNLVVWISEDEVNVGLEE